MQTVTQSAKIAGIHQNYKCNRANPNRRFFSEVQLMRFAWSSQGAKITVGNSANEVKKMTLKQKPPDEIPGDIQDRRRSTNIRAVPGDDRRKKALLRVPVPCDQHSTSGAETGPPDWSLGLLNASTAAGIPRFHASGKIGKDKEAHLDSFLICDGLMLHVLDPLLNVDEFRYLSKLVKVKLTEKVYNRCNNRAWAFLQKHSLGCYDGDAHGRSKRLEEEKRRKQRFTLNLIDVGNRFEAVHIAGSPRQCGALAYVGEVDFNPGVWVGDRYDPLLSKDDGSITRKRCARTTTKALYVPSVS